MDECYYGALTLYVVCLLDPIGLPDDKFIHFLFSLQVIEIIYFSLHLCINYLHKIINSKIIIILIKYYFINKKKQREHFCKFNSSINKKFNSF